MVKRPHPDTYVYLAGAFVFCGVNWLALLCISLYLTGGKPFTGHKRRGKAKGRP